MEFVKGKKNKLKIGDKVELTQECVNYYATHLVDIFSKPHNCIYGTEILNGHEEIHGYVDAYITKKMPRGVVVGYGAEDEIRGYNNVKVKIYFKYKTVESYFSEPRNLRKIKVKKAKNV
jgi:hypothetical protein